MRIFNLQGLAADLKKKSTEKLFLYLATTLKGSGDINFYRIVKKTYASVESTYCAALDRTLFLFCIVIFNSSLINWFQFDAIDFWTGWGQKKVTNRTEFLGNNFF
jgi:hypothetical protein